MSTKTESETIVLERDEDEITYVPRWHVIMWNDDYTPIDFVADMLVRYFEYPKPSARKRADKIERNGQAIIGTYTRDIAETKIAIVMLNAKTGGYPLKLTLEKELS